MPQPKVPITWDSGEAPGSQAESSALVTADESTASRGEAPAEHQEGLFCLRKNSHFHQ